jgi:hypothetical protein
MLSMIISCRGNSIDPIIGGYVTDNYGPAAMYRNAGWVVVTALLHVVMWLGSHRDHRAFLQQIAPQE